MLLYHIINGGTKSKLNQSMKGFNKVYNEFWINRFDELDNKVNYFLKNLFSNIHKRNIGSEIHNPNKLKIATFIFDCDGIITYVSDVKN